MKYCKHQRGINIAGGWLEGLLSSFEVKCKHGWTVPTVLERHTWKRNDTFTWGHERRCCVFVSLDLKIAPAEQAVKLSCSFLSLPPVFSFSGSHTSCKLSPRFNLCQTLKSNTVRLIWTQFNELHPLLLTEFHKPPECDIDTHQHKAHKYKGSTAVAKAVDKIWFFFFFVLQISVPPPHTY